MRTPPQVPSQDHIDTIIIDNRAPTIRITSLHKGMSTNPSEQVSPIEQPSGGSGRVQHLEQGKPSAPPEAPGPAKNATRRCWNIWILIVVVVVLVLGGVGAALAVFLTRDDSDDSPQCTEPLATPVEVSLTATTGSSHRLMKSDMSPDIVFFPMGKGKAVIANSGFVPAMGSTGTVTFELPKQFACGVSKFHARVRDDDPFRTDGWMMSALSIQVGAGQPKEQVTLKDPATGKTGIWLDGEPYDAHSLYQGYPYNSVWIFDLVNKGFPKKGVSDYDPNEDEEDDTTDSRTCLDKNKYCDPCFGSHMCCSGYCIMVDALNCIGTCF